MSKWLAGVTRRVAFAATVLMVAGYAAGTGTGAGNKCERHGALSAGLPPADGSSLAAAAQQGAWRRHADAMDAAWANIEKRQLARIREWRAAELSKPSPVLYYMFSGPISFYADALFPSATTYVLAALEPGPLPTLSRRRSETPIRSRSCVPRSTRSQLQFLPHPRDAYDARRNAFSGTPPILYIFLTRTGKLIDEVTFHDINEDGALVAPGEGRPRGAATVEDPVHRPRSQAAHALLRPDRSLEWRLAQEWLQGILRQARRERCADQERVVPAYTGAFSDVRDYLLIRSKRILQDDRVLITFKTDEWGCGPTAAISAHRCLPDNYQSRLADLFRREKPPRIDFGIGYRFRPNESNVLVADKLAVRAER